MKAEPTKDEKEALKQFERDYGLSRKKTDFEARRDAARNLFEAARAEGFKEAEKLHCAVSNIVQEANDVVEERIVEQAKEAGRQSALSNTLTKKAYEDAAIEAQKEIDDLKFEIGTLKAELAHEKNSVLELLESQKEYVDELVKFKTEKQERVRKLERDI